MRTLYRNEPTLEFEKKLLINNPRMDTWAKAGRLTLLTIALLKEHKIGASALLIFALHGYQAWAQSAPPLPDDSFPACIQFSAVPSGNGWRGQASPISAECQRDTLQNLVQHGFSVLYYPVAGVTDSENQEILSAAQALGMRVNFMTGGFELFDREHPPSISVYSSNYAPAVAKAVADGLAPMKGINRIYSVFPFQDEPFHAGPDSFDYSEPAKAEFRRRYGYPMPANVETARHDPKAWLDLLNFQSETFRDGWRQVYRAVKEFDPRPKIVLTHDSHGTFGAGVKSDSRMAIDDVFHWGGDFADVFIYDIYPYTMFDYRYGDFGRIPKPRISQLHYTMSQLRNLTTTYRKELAFWVGTYNQAWFKDFLSPEREKEYWGERELALTAIAHGANYLVTGLNVPADARHWEDFGEGMRLVQKAGPGLLRAQRVPARTAFVFPRSQYLQLQEECFNVGLAFELVLRAFGELDILHEDQLCEDHLGGYQALVLCDVRLLADAAARNIERFVRRGGVVVADCMPRLNEYRQPNHKLEALFGVRGVDAPRLVRQGHWIPYSTRPPLLVNGPPGDAKEINPPTVAVAGKTFGQRYQFNIAAPRTNELVGATMRLSYGDGRAALASRRIGKGRTYLFGFSMQESFFRTYQAGDASSRRQLLQLIREIFQESKIRAHVRTSEADVEATIRANAEEGYLFLINHEAPDAQVKVEISDLDFRVVQARDLASGQPVPFRRTRHGIQLALNSPFASTRLLRLSR